MGYYRLISIMPKSSVDPDAQAFITAAGITNTTQQQAINTLVVSLKGYGIWSKMKAIYPFVGGTASAHKFNLKDPRDLDAAFRLVFTGGWTHSITGAQPNGTNGYADTKFNPFSQFSNNTSAHYSIYSRTNDANKAWVDMGSTTATSNAMALTTYNNLALSYIYNDSTGISTANTNSLGYYIGTRTASNIHKLFKNNSQLGTTDTSSNGTRPNLNIFLGAYNRTISGIGLYSQRQYAFASIGDGLTDTEAANLYTAVQTYQTALNRQV